MANLTAEQKLWKVEVLCEGLVPLRVSSKKATNRLERRYTTILVQANEPQAAMEAAQSYADANASPDVQWKAFTPLNAARFVLPMAVEDLR